MALSKSLTELAAYQGGSWQKRETDIWSDALVNSEWARVKTVMLVKLPRKPAAIKNPERVQHIRAVQWPKLKKQISLLANAYRRSGARVAFLEADWFTQSSPNLFFARDLAFMTPWGVVIGRMASQVRAGEEKWAQLAFAKLGIPLLHLIRGRATFEGADALWLNQNTVVVGVGNRTNREGFVQLQSRLKVYNVKCIAVPLPRKVQHLLGLLQIVDRDLALVRTKISSPVLLRLLAEHKFKIVSVPEVDEVVERQAMNVVTVGARNVIMAKGCPEFQRLLLKNRIKISATVEISELVAAAGGIACATAIVHRAPAGPRGHN